ncbi:MAG: hypothetical protein ACTSQA_08555 [Candidatus Heimdallarchaeaceae archaeon]
MTNVKVYRKTVPDNQEIDDMIFEAQQIRNPYFKHRALATIAYLQTGKRQSEIASLEVKDHSQDDDYLYVTFTLRKKRKKNIFLIQSTKKYKLTSRYAIFILDYLRFLEEKVHTEFIYPSGRNVFDCYVIDKNKMANPKLVYRIVKQLNPKAWTHLFREKRAVEVIRADEKKFGRATLETVYRVMRVLDLKSESSAWNYIRRHEVQKVEEEEQIIS